MEKPSSNIVKTNDTPSTAPRSQIQKIWQFVLNLLHFKFVMVLRVLIVCCCLAFLLLNNKVQTYLGKRATNYLNERADFTYHIGYLGFDLDGDLQLGDVLVLDRKGRTLVTAKSLNADIDLFKLLTGKFKLTKIILGDGGLNMVVEEDSKLFNIQELTADIYKALNYKPPKSTKRFYFSIPQIELQNAYYSYHDPTKDSLTAGMFDYSHFRLDSLYGKVFNLELMTDTVQFYMDQVKTFDAKSSVRINYLKGFFRYCNKSMALGHFLLKTPKSVVRDSVLLSYESPKSFANFNQKVKIQSFLDSSVIQTEELLCFSPSLKAYDERILISAHVEGTVNKLNISKAKIKLKDTELAVRELRLEGLPDVKNTNINLNVENAALSFEDLKTYLPPTALPYLNRLGQVVFNGEFGGKVNNFKAKGNFNTALGMLQADGELDTEKQIYDGFVSALNFDLARLLDIKTLGKATWNGHIEGTGFDVNTAALNLDVAITQAQVMGYNYQNGIVKGDFKNKQFMGLLELHDPNINFVADVDADLKDTFFIANADIAHLDLKGLGFIEDELTIKTKLKTQFSGVNPDHLKGFAQLENSSLKVMGKEFDFKDITLSAKQDNFLRTLLLQTDYFDAGMTGSFTTNALLADALDMWRELDLHLNYDSLRTKRFFNDSTRMAYQADSTYQLSYFVNLKNIDPLLNSYLPYSHIDPNARIVGEWQRKTNLSFSLNCNIDTVNISDEYVFMENSMNFVVNREKSRSPSTSILRFFSGQQEFGTSLQTQLLKLNFDWSTPQVNFNTYIKHAKSDDYFSMGGVYAFMQDSASLRVIKPALRIIGDNWKSEQSVLVGIKGKDIHIEKPIQFNSRKQAITLKGHISSDNQKKLDVDINSLNMKFLSLFMGREVRGTTNAQMTLTDMYNTLKMDGQLKMDHFEIDSSQIGDITAFVDWNNARQELQLNANLLRDKISVLKTIGSIKPQGDNNFNLSVMFDSTKMEILQAFTKGIVSEMQGLIVGKVNINGPFAQPVIKGQAFIHKGGFKVDYLNTKYFFEDKVLFREGFIGVKRIHLFDEKGQMGYLDGGAYYDDGFEHLLLDVKGEMSKMKVLGTNRESQQPFYGDAYATGNFRVSGSLQDILIEVRARSEYGTHVVLPLDTYESVEQKAFIEYLPPPDTLKEVKIADTRVLKEKENTKLRMKFDLEVTPDAFAEIIFDQKAGDIIRGNGDGKLNMEIDTKGNFTMFGDVKILKGAYNFTFLNVIDKEFGVMPGSHITWNGDPFGAILDIQATYTQAASLMPIITNADSSIMRIPAIRRRYPIRVDMFLKGDLLKPDIGFGIDVLEYPSVVNDPASGATVSLESYVSSFENRLNNDIQELNRQVFSLIALKKLASQNTFQGINAGGSVSELLTNQLSNWMSQVDENLEFDLDLNGLNADAIRAIQLRLSYSFMQGRMRITREGTFTDPQNNVNASSVLGDWTLEYLVTPSGRLRVKAFHKNNISNFNAALRGNTSAGASILYSINFEHVRELFRIKKRRKKTAVVIDNEIVVPN
ncbi:MAG: hypothetical protein EAZ57_05930 [Cytophagales bacterium]|nr:MAG: hypothetical protein EAZ67_06835 [Cytophagales bacterium]TAF60887.1 MAG: hypothetical protein EAZ57_05930 [Cytophagales bacterium]